MSELPPEWLDDIGMSVLDYADAGARVMAVLDAIGQLAVNLHCLAQLPAALGTDHHP